MRYIIFMLLLSVATYSQELDTTVVVKTSGIVHSTKTEQVATGLEGSIKRHIDSIGQRDSIGVALVSVVGDTWEGNYVIVDPEIVIVLVARRGKFPNIDKLTLAALATQYLSTKDYSQPRSSAYSR